jgi:hypothetical protein
VETRSKWTVLVYMVADTGDSFYQDAMADITEMMKAQFDDRIRVVVHADAPSPWETKCWKVKGTPKDRRWVDSSRDGRGNKDWMWSHVAIGFCSKGAWALIRRIIYLLVLWGHGEGNRLEAKGLLRADGPAHQSREPASDLRWARKEPLRSAS